MSSSFKNIVSYTETNVPSDTISCIQITRNNQLFCTSSWDGDVRCYGINRVQNSIQSSPMNRISLGVPATSCCWTLDGTQIIAGGGDGKVHLWNVASGASTPTQIAQHNKGIVSVSINTQTNLLTVGSLDGDIGLYDLRSPSQCVRCSLLLPVDASQCQGVFNSALQWVSRLAGLLRSVDSSQFAFTNGNDIFIYDLTNPSNPFKTIVSSESDDFITSLAFSPRKYFAHGLLNGLVVVEFLRVPYDGTTIDKDLRFRVGKNTNNIQHTVTGICFHNPSEYIFTCAGNGALILWDCVNRSRVQDFEKSYSTSIQGITACCNSYDGSTLVYAKGYAWDLGAPSTVPKSYKIDTSVELICKSIQSIVC